MSPAIMTVATMVTASPPILSLATWFRGKAAIILLTPPPLQARDDQMAQFGQNQSTLLPNNGDSFNVGKAREPNQGNEVLHGTSQLDNWAGKKNFTD